MIENFLLVYFRLKQKNLTKFDFKCLETLNKLENYEFNDGNLKKNIENSLIIIPLLLFKLEFEKTGIIIKKVSELLLKNSEILFTKRQLKLTKIQCKFENLI